MTDIDYTTLDPGIREVVRLLRAAGLETTDSGDGVSKAGGPLEGCFMPVPHVVIRVKRADQLVWASCFVLAVLQKAGVSFDLTDEQVDRLANDDPTGALRQVEATFDPVSMVALVTVWGVTDADLRAP